jgi:hypothetical protein
MLDEQIRALVRRYLDRGIDRSAFSEQFAALYLQVRNSRASSLEARSLCNSLILPFAELSRGHRSEDSFRKELSKLVHPFAVKLYWYEANVAPEKRVYDALSASPGVKSLEVGVYDRADAFGYGVGDIADVDAREPSKKLAASARIPHPVEATA